jgi:hypothetical protein
MDKISINRAAAILTEELVEAVTIRTWALAHPCRSRPDVKSLTPVYPLALETRGIAGVSFERKSLDCSVCVG